jgi:hypothetical protein
MFYLSFLVGVNIHKATIKNVLKLSIFIVLNQSLITFILILTEYEVCEVMKIKVLIPNV